MTRQNISSGSPFEPTIGFSRAVRSGEHVYVSGTAPIWPGGEVDPDPAAQARRCWEIALGALAQAGGRPEHVVRTRMFLASREVEEPVSQVHGEVFGSIRPATTMVLAGGLLDERWHLEVELDAHVVD